MVAPGDVLAIALSSSAGHGWPGVSGGYPNGGTFYRNPTFGTHNWTSFLSVDFGFRTDHDLAYLQGLTLEELIASDRLLISQLEALDTTNFSPQAEAYRQRAIGYFNQRISRIVGKPPDVVIGKKRKPVVIDTSPGD